MSLVRLIPVALRESVLGIEIVIAVHKPGYDGTVVVHASRDGRVLRCDAWDQIGRDLLPELDERIARIAAEASREWPTLVERTAS